MEHQDRLLKNVMLGDEIAKHLIDMADMKTFGEEYEIRALEEIYDRKIEIYSYHENPNKMLRRDAGDEIMIPPEEAPFRLAYHNGIHYNSVVPKDPAVDPLPLAKGNMKSTYRILNHRIKTWEQKT